jgi:hypothetical protein
MTGLSSSFSVLSLELTIMVSAPLCVGLVSSRQCIPRCFPFSGHRPGN